MQEYIIIITTTSSYDEANKIAKALLNSKLSACITISEIKSQYIWQDKLEESNEYKLEIKSLKALFREIEALIKDLHSYETPEIIAIPIIFGSKDYLNWLKSEVASESI